MALAHRRKASHPPLTAESLADIARRFRALADPTRLAILQVLKSGEATVGTLSSETGARVAAVSKGLQQLHRAGFVTRRREGLFIWYALRGRDDVLAICEVMCDRVVDHARSVARVARAIR